MAKIKLNGDTSGYIEISAPAVSGNNTLELGPGTKILTNLDNTFTGIATFSNGIHITSGGFILNQQRSDTHASLIIDKPDAGTGTLKFFNNGSASAYIQHTNSEHLNYYLPSGSGSQVFYTNGTERLRITSAGDLEPAEDIKLTKSSDPRIYANTNVGLNIDGMALYLNRYVSSHVASNMGGGSFGIGAVPATGDGATYNNWDTPKLYVEGPTGAGQFHLLGRFRAGQDSDATGAQIVIHHENDRGMALQGGRSSGNKSYGAIKSLDNLARESNVMVFDGGNGQGVDNIKFYTGTSSNSTTERLRIRSDGKISAGTAINTTNTYEFSVTGADGTGGFYAHGRNHYLSNRSNAYSSLTLKKANADSDGIDYLQLRDSSNVLKGTITGAGNWKPISGGGIDFSATSDASGSTSELLDDYEEGTWTPQLLGGSSNPSLTYSAQSGGYEKIGNLVHLSFFMHVSAVNSQGSGYLELHGLPYSPVTSPLGASEVPALVLQTQPFADGKGANKFAFVRTVGGSSRMFVGYRDLTNGNAIIPSQGAGNISTGYFIGHITYRSS